MKQVTLNASDVSQYADATVITLVTSEAPYMWRDIVVPNVFVHSVEAIPDPLPTEPGDYFLGKTNMQPAQRWFVREIPAASGAGVDLWYVPTRRNCVPLDAREAAACGLVRLPDPEVAP